MTAFRHLVLSLVIIFGWPLPAQGATDYQQADALFQEGYTLYQRHYATSALTSAHPETNKQLILK